MKIIKYNRQEIKLSSIVWSLKTIIITTARKHVIR